MIVGPLKMERIFLRPLLLACRGHVASVPTRTRSTKSLPSSLYVSSKRAQEVFAVLKPRYDASFIEHLTTNFEQAKANTTRRGMAVDNNEWDQMRASLTQFKVKLGEFNSLKKKREKMLKKLKKQNKTTDEDYRRLTDDYLKVKAEFNQLEELVVPFILNVPTQIRADVPDDVSVVIDQAAGKSVANVPNQPALSFMRLGYISNTFLPSLNAPNGKYLLGEGAQLYHALSQYLQNIFNLTGYKLISGLDIVKSAIVEACNTKYYADDPAMICMSNDTEEDKQNQRLHLVGDASLEALCALLSKKTECSSSRYFQLGSVYEDSPLVQQHVARASIIAPSQESDQDMEQLYRLVWTLLANHLNVRCESRRVPASKLQANEYARYDLLTTLPSGSEPLSLGHIVHHHDYILQRLGASNYGDHHLLTCRLDLVALIKSIFEHYHDPTNARLIRPECLEQFYLN